jgi:hypothetical protein
VRSGPVVSECRIESTGVSLPLLESCIPTSFMICSVKPGCVRVIDLSLLFLDIWTPRNAETSPSSFNLKVLDKALITSSITDGVWEKKRQSSTYTTIIQSCRRKRHLSVEDCVKPC